MKSAPLPPESRPEATEEAIARLGPWFHNLHLPDGAQTVPNHPLGGDFPAFKWAEIARVLPSDLSGWSVLDIGCNAGFYSIALAERGADVLGIDHDPHYLDQARWAVGQFGLEDKVELRRLEVYELGSLDLTFDLVLFMGVFYHLRHPLLGLDLAAEKVERMMIFQTLSLPGDDVAPRVPDVGLDERKRLEAPGWPKMAFVEDHLAGDPTNWWVPNHACILAMLRSTGLRVVGQPGHEIYVCTRD
ncbi:TIGR04290 family methyltransferase [Myxococcota bacterium]|nr:TIGR04290 family methyltransferase [Myxococcota bacterium]